MNRNIILLAIAIMLFAACHKKDSTAPIPVAKPTIDSTKIKPQPVQYPGIFTQVPPYTDTFYGEVHEGDYSLTLGGQIIDTIHVYAYHNTNHQIIFSSESFNAPLLNMTNIEGTFTVNNTNYYSWVFPSHSDIYYNFKLTDNSLIYHSSYDDGPDDVILSFTGYRINKL